MNLETYIQSLIDGGAIPGLTILVAGKNGTIFSGCWGWKSLLPERRALSAGCLYDLASLTKPLVTAFLAAYLLQRRQLRLDDPVRLFLSEVERPLTIGQLLTHSAGLPAWYPFYLYPDDFLSQVNRLKLQHRPGRQVLYSCVGYMLLLHVLEKVLASEFKAAAAEIIFRPLGLQHTFLSVPSGRRLEAAPCEFGNRYERSLCRGSHRQPAAKFPWRDYLIQGEAHDANSFYAGGTAGNSGLFSCAEEVLRISREFFPDTALILKADVIRLFWNNLTPHGRSHRSLGFKLNSSVGSSGGRALASGAVGHNGFTGTSLWLEPDSENVFVLLSNRIHPRVPGGSFDRVRRRLHRLLKANLGLG